MKDSKKTYKHKTKPVRITLEKHEIITEIAKAEKRNLQTVIDMMLDEALMLRNRKRAV